MAHVCWLWEILAAIRCGSLHPLTADWNHTFHQSVQCHLVTKFKNLCELAYGKWGLELSMAHLFSGVLSYKLDQTVIKVSPCQPLLTINSFSGHLPWLGLDVAHQPGLHLVWQPSQRDICFKAKMRTERVFDWQNQKIACGYLKS